MPSRIIGKYRPCFSPKAQETLNKPEAKQFTINTSAYAKAFFDKFHDHFGDGITLNYQLLGVALNSAFVDLASSLDLHEMRGGPSPTKKSAAIACWINRLKPIQIVAPLTDERIWYINSHFALMVALVIKFKEEGREGDIHEILNENKRFHDLMYAMMWRNPSYRELTTTFHFI